MSEEIPDASPPADPSTFTRPLWGLPAGVDEEAGLFEKRQVAEGDRDLVEGKQWHVSPRLSPGIA